VEKRGERRRRVRLTVQVEPGSIRAHSADLSSGGIFIVSAKILNPGTRVRLMVRTPEGPVLGVGVVRWAKRVPTSLIRTTRGGMGIEFTWMSPELRELVERSTNPAPKAEA
jgi:uncharacterized protein (TIGR02266 family)